MGETISFEIPLDQKFLSRLLANIYDYQGERPSETTFLKLAKRMRLDLEKKGRWDKLRFHLFFAEREGLLEERHLEDGVVDYELENNGLDRVHKEYQEKHDEKCPLP
ncbi:MAG: hypothetical protein ABH867_01180 [Patescibacteria group bacterium]